MPAASAVGQILAYNFKMSWMKWHIGCSGFSYREWKDVFYPPKLPQRKWFEYYATQFDTLELNVTFYKFPEAAVLKKWYDAAPDHFYFTVKAPRVITHFKQLKDCESLLDDFYGVVENNLREKTGCLLFQMPPRFIYTPERLQLIKDALRPGFKNVVELRDKSWWNDEVYAALGEQYLTFSGISHPTLPAEAVVNHHLAYYRFHGVPRLYYSEYEYTALKEVANQLLAQTTLEEVFVYFNNTAAIGAIANARWLKEYVGGFANRHCGQQF